MIVLPPDAPSVRYYRAMTGTWSGPYRFVITDRAAMRAAVPSPIDRLRFALFHALGRSRMTTTVTWLADHEVRHTTRITNWGIPSMSSTEVFRLNDDGWTIAVRMVQHMLPAFWSRREFPEGSGVVQAPDVGADYRLPWIGGEIDQRARVVADGVEIKQSTPWFRAEVVLRRVPDRPTRPSHRAGADRDVGQG